MERYAKFIENVEIENLCPWPLYFKRANSMGDVKLEPAGKLSNYIEYDELRSQIQRGNNLFVGIDGRGNHARVRICDDEARKTLLGKESDNAILLTAEAIDNLLAIKNREKFREELKSLIVTSSEKKALFEATRDRVDDLPKWVSIEIDNVIKGCVL